MSIRIWLGDRLKAASAGAPAAIVATTPIRRFQHLARGQVWASENGRLTLGLDRAGVLYAALDGKTEWRPHVTTPATRLLLENDGELSLWKDQERLWAVGRPGCPNAELRLQDDGNAVLYNNNIALWWTGTHL